MMFSDDLCSTVNIGSPAFTELDDTGNDEQLDEEPNEMKYDPPVPVKAEIEDLIPAGAPLTEDDIDDHFLNSFDTTAEEDAAVRGERGFGNEAAAVGGGGELERSKKSVTENRGARDSDKRVDERAWATWSEKPKKKKPLPPGTARRGGGRKQMSRGDRNRVHALTVKQKRALMTPEEKEELREKRKAEKQFRKMHKHRQEEEESLHVLAGEDGDNNAVKKEEENQLSRRPSRQAKLKAVIKDEPESADEGMDDFADEDYYVDDDDDEDFRIGKKKSKNSSHKKTARKSTGGVSKLRTPRKPRHNKKVSDMTEEEQQKVKVKWREQARVKRARKRGDDAADGEVGEIDDKSGNENIVGAGKKKRGRRKRKNSEGSSTSRRSGSGVRRKKISEMTEEEREAIKRKWREEARLKRARQRETMTPQEREEYLRIQREKRREQRALAKVTMTEEEKEQENRKARERKKAKRALMTPEQRKEEAQKVTLRRIERLATMTEEEKKNWRMNNYLQNMARMSRMSSEEMEQRRQQRLDYAKRRREKMTAEDLERRRLRTKAYRDAMTPDRRARFLEKLREGYRRRLERLKEDPNKWEEVKGRWKEDRLRRQKKMVEMGKCYVRKKQSTTPRRRYTRKRDPNETPEERAERIRESRRRTQKKIKLKKKLAMQKLLESGMSLDEIQQQIETPEQRERRLMRHRINRAKWNLRKRLEGVGAPPEEIEQKLSELTETYQPTFQFRPYKPRPDAWKPIDPSDLALLEDENEKKPEITTAAIPSTTSTVIIPTTSTLFGISPKKEPKPSTSTKPTGTGRRGRPPKNLALIQQQQLQQQEPQQQEQPQPTPPIQVLQPNSTVIIQRGSLSSVPIQFQVQFQPTTTTMGYPPQVSSPAGASTCSYVSAAETPEPIHYTSSTTTQLIQPFTTQQQNQQPQYTTTQYHFQQVPVVYHHQQPQTQTQTYTLQNILDSITFQESGTVAPTIVATSAATAPATAQVIYQHQENSSSHNDYASSYDNHSPPPSSPPASPGGIVEDHDYTANATFGDFPFNRPPPPPSSTFSTDSSNRKRGRPRKDEPPRPKKPKGSKCGHRPGPRGPKKSNKTGVIHDAVCDECGNAYNHSYLREHKNQFHNPNYKDQKCQICGEEFKVARHWYTHYIRTHVGPTMDTKDKPHMCDSCGQSFRQKNNLEKHKYYMHGDGLKKENFKRCPVCPGEKLFKETVSLYAHLRRKHPGYNRGGHDCYRCDKTFPDEKNLSSHCQQEHADSYFPCQYCNACRFTRFGLNFHYFRCTKISKEVRDRMRKSEGTFSLDREPLPCEFCGRKVAIFSLTRHYWEMHNVREDSFTCPECGKGFRVREFWAVHMEEKHSKTLDQMKDLVRCLNVKNREGLVIKNPDGVKGGVPGNTPSKAASQKRIELGVAKKGGRVKGQKVKSKGGRKRKREIVVTAEEEGDEDNEEEENAESSEDETRDDDEYQAPRRFIGGRIRRREIIIVAEEEEQLRASGVLGKSETKKKKKPGRKPGRKPGPKSKTRRKKWEESEEEEEEEEEDDDEDISDWKGSDEEEAYNPTRKSDQSKRRSSTRPRTKPIIDCDEEEESGDKDRMEEEAEEEPNYDNLNDDGDRPLTPIDEDQILEAVVKQEILSDGEDGGEGNPREKQSEEEQPQQPS